MTHPDLETSARRRDWLGRVQRFSRRRTVRIALPLLIVGFLAFWRPFLTPDILFFILLAIFFAYGMAFQFLVRFIPFLGLLLSYDALRGLVPFVNNRVHFDLMANFDRWLGHGVLPTQILQNWLYHEGLSWYDYAFYLLYMMHFVVPILFGVLIWRLRPWAYWHYVWGLVVLSYAGFVTYLIFPAAPPWMAAQQGHIPMIEKLSTDIWVGMGVHNFPTIYEKLSPNLVAAVPSLHAAYPTLVVLFIGRLFGWRWALPALLYPLTVWLGIVYMGEHYVFDVLIGIVYAGVSFLVVERVGAWRRHRRIAKSQAPALTPETAA